MATIDKDLFDRLIHRQIAVGRYGERVVRDIIGELNKADRELLAKIAARGEDGTFTTARLNALLKEIKSMVTQSYRQLGDGLQEEMGKFAPHAAEFAGATLASQLPGTWNPVAISDEQLVAIVDKTPISIGPDKKLLLEEVFSSMAAHKEEAIRGAIRLGMVQGEDIQSLTRRLKGTRLNQYQDGILEGSRRSMASLVRTAVQSVNNTAVQAVYSKNADVLKGWTWCSTLDSRTCFSCAARSNVEKKLGEGPFPPIHLQCRCFQLPSIRSWKELGFDDLPEFGKFDRASKDGPVDSEISFGSWLKTQNKDVQVEMLGPARQKMFASGELQIEKLVDSSGKTHTLEELKKNAKR